jgi:hypothetical protein
MDMDCLFTGKNSKLIKIYQFLFVFNVVIFITNCWFINTISLATFVDLI